MGFYVLFLLLSIADWVTAWQPEKCWKQQQRMNRRSHFSPDIAGQQFFRLRMPDLHDWWTIDIDQCVRDRFDCWLSFPSGERSVSDRLSNHSLSLFPAIFRLPCNDAISDAQQQHELITSHSSVSAAALNNIQKVAAMCMAGLLFNTV